MSHDRGVIKVLGLPLTTPDERLTTVCRLVVVVAGGVSYGTPRKSRPSRPFEKHNWLTEKSSILFIYLIYFHEIRLFKLLGIQSIHNMILKQCNIIAILINKLKLNISMTIKAGIKSQDDRNSYYDSSIELKCYNRLNDDLPRVR